jgi:hypothetical protein
LETPTEERLFSLLSVPKCYKQDSQLRVNSWSNELAVRQLPAGINMSTEAEVIVGIYHQETTGKDIGN